MIAFAEAVSWVGLLVGMYFKYLGSPRTEVGVKVFGPVHGGIFIAFVVTGLLTGIACDGRPAHGCWRCWVAVVPLGSVSFLIWADRTGRMGTASAVAATAEPGRTAPEST